MSAEDYIPPLRYQFLTRFYDPIVRWTTREGGYDRVVDTAKFDTPLGTMRLLRAA